MNSGKIILDLCGGTGAWSKPYKDAGYDVRVITLPENDISTWQISRGQLIFGFQMGKFHGTRVNVNEVYGILAAPPCTMFSLARTTAKSPRDFEKGMATVEDCMKIIWEVRKRKKLHFWALENPKGLLRQFLGNPLFSFDASEFGETYNKATDLWGYYKIPRKKEEYRRFSSTDKNTRKLPKIPEGYKVDQTMNLTAIKRSITPHGFAQAFFKANR